MLTVYPASGHGNCVPLPKGRFALRTSYELSYLLVAANCGFALRLAFSKKDDLKAGEMFLVSRTQGPQYIRFLIIVS